LPPGKGLQFLLHPPDVPGALSIDQHLSRLVAPVEAGLEGGPGPKDEQEKEGYGPQSQGQTLCPAQKLPPKLPPQQGGQDRVLGKERGIVDPGRGRAVPPVLPQPVVQGPPGPRGQPIRRIL